MKWVVILLVVAAVGVAAFVLSRQEGTPEKMAERVVFRTEDGLQIIGDYAVSPGASYAAILLHMMPAGRSSYSGFAAGLKEAGMSSLAIDLRGHGESDGGPDGYRNFEDEEHQRSILDVEAATEFLESNGFEASHQIVLGASIGANLALEFAAAHPEVRAVVALSPGLNYRGIEAEPLIKKLQAGQAVLIATSEDDERSGGNNADMSRRLRELVPDGVVKRLIVYSRAGHGTDMFGREEPDLEQEIIDFLQTSTKHK